MSENRKESPTAQGESVYYLHCKNMKRRFPVRIDADVNELVSKKSGSYKHASTYIATTSIRAYAICFKVKIFSPIGINLKKQLYI